MRWQHALSGELVRPERGRGEAGQARDPVGVRSQIPEGLIQDKKCGL